MGSLTLKVTGPTPLATMVTSPIRKAANREGHDLVPQPHGP